MRSIADSSRCRRGDGLVHGAGRAENTTNFKSFQKVSCQGYKAGNKVRHGFCIGFVEGVAVTILNDQPSCTRLQEEWKSNALMDRIEAMQALDPADFPKQTGQAVEKWLRETFNCPRARR